MMWLALLLLPAFVCGASEKPANPPPHIFFNVVDGTSTAP
jgi:hypothetical protein